LVSCVRAHFLSPKQPDPLSPHFIHVFSLSCALHERKPRLFGSKEIFRASNQKPSPSLSSLWHPFPPPRRKYNSHLRGCFFFLSPRFPLFFPPPRDFSPNPPGGVSRGEVAYLATPNFFFFFPIVPVFLLSPFPSPPGMCLLLFLLSSRTRLRRLHPEWGRNFFLSLPQRAP